MIGRVAVMLAAVAVVVAPVGAAGADRGDRPRSTAGEPACTWTGTPDRDIRHATAPGEVLCGEGGSDVLSPWPAGGGDAFADVTLRGGPGADHLFSGSGDETLDGGTDVDTVYFGCRPDIDTGCPIPSGDGVHVDLAAGFAAALGSSVDPHPAFGFDTLIDIEAVFGSPANDRLEGTDATDRLQGRGGDDVLEGRGGNDYLYGGRGDDTLLGGAGIQDEAYYDESDADALKRAGGWLPVAVDLAAGIAGAKSGGSHAYFGQDTLESVETVWGTRAADRLLGSAADERIFGRGGDDEIDGRAGNDDLFGDDPYFFRNRATIRGQDGILRPLYANGADVIRGGPGDDRLSGGLGIDTLRGDTGNDVVSYDAQDPRRDTAVQVDLTARRVTGAQGADILLDVFEGVLGGKGDDTLLGSAKDDHIMGAGGADRIEGRGGDDTLIAGVPAQWYGPPWSTNELFARDPADDGADVLLGGRGNDLLAAADRDGKRDRMGGGDRLTGDGGAIGGEVDVCRSVTPDRDTLACVVKARLIVPDLDSDGGPAPTGGFELGNDVVDHQGLFPDFLPRRYTTLRLVIHRGASAKLDDVINSEADARAILCPPFRRFPSGLLHAYRPYAETACEAYVQQRYASVKRTLGALPSDTCLVVKWSLSAGGNIVYWRSCSRG